MDTKTLRLLGPAALFLPVLLAFATPVDGPRFAPAKGATVTKTFENVAEFALEDLSILADGQDVGGMMGPIEVTVRNEVTVTVTDVYGGVADGRPLTVERSFDKIENNSSAEISSEFANESQETPSESNLEGQTVVFTWNEEEGEYNVAFKDNEGDESLLEGLEENMDLRMFLPEGDVATGDTWKVDLKGLGAVVMPGGNLGYVPESTEEVDMGKFEDILGDGFEDMLDDVLQGECECEYKGTRDEGGVTVAEIAIKLEVHSAVDLSEIILNVIDAIAEMSEEEAPDLDIDAADLNLDYEGEGTLLWNMEQGIPYSFELSGDAEVALDFGITAEGSSVEATIELSGTVSQKLTTAD